MNKFMKKMAKKEGFTLVELIIVIAILAILSSAAVAGYSSYITKANTSAVNTELSNISTAAVLANAEAGSISKITVEASGKTWTITIEADAFDTDDDGFDYLFRQTISGAQKKADSSTDTKYVYTVPSNAKWDSSDYKGKNAEWDNNAWTAKNAA